MNTARFLPVYLADRFHALDTVAVKAGAVTGAVVQLVLGDTFAYLFGILVLSNIADWIFGRHAARAEDRFSKTESRNGLVGKGAQLTILLILRTLEAGLPVLGGPSTLGLGSAALCLALILEDVESLERHMVALGGSRIPGLSAALDKLRLVTGGERRGSGGEEVADSGHRRRATDRPPEGAS